jgi:hypothetical protein
VKSVVRAKNLAVDRIHGRDVNPDEPDASVGEEGSRVRT